MADKIVIIGGKGTAVVIAEQIYDAANRFNMDVEVLGFAFDDPAYNEGINGWPILCGTREEMLFCMFSRQGESRKYISHIICVILYQKYVKNINMNLNIIM